MSRIPLSSSPLANGGDMAHRGSPAPAKHAPSPLSDAGSGSARRQHQSRRDEAIRKKIETELNRKRPTAKSSRSGTGKRRGQAGTVSALKPLPALTVPESMTVSEASQLCAAKRTDCVLVVDDEEHLCGIFTAKDLAFRVIGEGLDPRATSVSQIMTRNPMVTRDTTSATDALQTMVQRGFRHLPVCNDEGDVVGLLDITKVFHESLEKLERAYGSSQQLYSALEGVQSEWTGTAGAQAGGLMAYVEQLREKMAFPDIGSILDARTRAATVTVRTSVRDAAKLMHEHRTTAVIVLESDGQKIAGIFTSKDVVLRVIAAGLDAKTCSVVRVMTPHPDTAPPTMSIQQALRKMNDGHYLNLPIVDETGKLIGCVDVLKLTYATLEQVNSIGGENGDESGGPMWSKFFASFGGAGSAVDADTESVVSEHGPASSMHDGVHRGALNGLQSELAPDDSASAAGVTPDLPPSVVDDGTYLFKFLSPSGTNHRFQAQYEVESCSLIREIVGGKLQADSFFSTLGPEADPLDFQLLYTDDEGDRVLITHDRDIGEAVNAAKKQGKDRVVLFVKGGKGWAEATPALKEEPKPVAAPAPELLFGVLPKDLALPAAIGALSVVIIGVFIASRAGKK